MLRAKPMRQPVSLHGRLLEEQSAFDELLGEVAIGVRSAGHYDNLEAAADAFCARVRAAFRDCKGKPA